MSAKGQKLAKGMLSGDVRFGSKAGILFSQQNVRYVTEADVGESEDRSAGAKRGTQQAGHADGKDRPHHDVEHAGNED